MRISELSRAGGVPIPTLKFYLREGLLPLGTHTAPNQAEYTDVHLKRLRLIRALTEIGGLKLRAVRAVLHAVEEERLSTHDLLGVAHHALGPESGREPTPPDVAQARADVDRFLDGLGWRVSPQAPGRWELARALATLRRFRPSADAQVFEPYARAAEQVAAREVASVPAGPRGEAVEVAVVGTVVFESALVALRRLAQEHHSALRFAPARR